MHSTIIILFLCAGVFISLWRYGRTQLSASKKVVLMILRTGWILGLILSFLEPVIRFDRFESGSQKVAVLVDASLSMQNFSADSFVNNIIDTLSSMEKRSGGQVNFQYFLFGDSTRNHNPSKSINFSDSKSSFPLSLGTNERNRDMIIISDGHWTNPAKSSSIFPTNTIYYVTLPDAVPNSFVKTITTAPQNSPVDSQFTVSVEASGFAQTDGNLTIRLKKKGTIVKTEIVQIEQGYFTRRIDFRTSNRRPAKELYTVEASLDSDTPPSVSNFVHQTIPQNLTYSIYSAKASLDRRYLSQALLANKTFKEKSSSPDILFLFDYDSTAIRLMRTLPRHGVAVFMGTLPCSSRTIYSPAVSIRQTSGMSAASNPSLRALPPAAEIIICNNLSLTGRKNLLEAAVSTETSADSESSSILFSGRFRGTYSLFCPVKGIWRWDFWPMSSDRAESELFSFSNTLLATAKELLLDNISDEFILYPAQMLHETDSARFMMSLPSSVPIFETFKLEVKIQNENISIDTTLNYYPTGLNKQPLSFKTLSEGSYSISSKITAGNIRAEFSDSFTVNRDMSELSVLSQNTQYLQEFAHPLDFGDSDALQTLFTSWNETTSGKNTVTETIRISRSWLLLSIMLLLLAAELVMRRKYGVD
ncbi:MAG: hypothetical protein FWE57_05810 [Chitinispirillia bacterium]|nr:hypothetical protein [Chitinispirillia bacterium]